LSAHRPTLVAAPRRARAARCAVALCVAALALAAPAWAEPTPPAATPANDAKPAPRQRFEEGVAALRTGDAAGAVALLSEAFETLRAAGRIGDAGVVARWLAQAMEATGHAQTDEAYAFALAALERAPDARVFLDAARALMRRDGEGRGEWAADKLVARVVAGMDEATREEAIAALVKHYAAPGRERRRDAAMARLAGVEGGGELLVFLRATTRSMQALDVYKQGRLADARAMIEANMGDLRAAARPDALALASLLKARIDYADGAYTQALPAADEAEALMRGERRDRALWVEALSIKARLLERLDRPNDAVETVRAAEATLKGEEAQGALLAMLRLDRVTPLLRAERIDEARALLESEKARLKDVDFGGELQALFVAAFNDRVAALMIAEKDFSRAKAAAQAALETLAPLSASADGLRMESSRRLAEALAGGVDAQATEAALRQAVALSERLFSPSHPEVAYDLSAYALHLKDHDRLEEAQTTLRRIAEILARAHAPDSLKHAYALANLADATARRGGYEEAEGLLARAQEIVAAAHGPPERRVEMLALLSNMRRLRGDARGALRAIGEAAELARALPQDKRSFGLKLMVDGSAAAALLDVGDDAQAWRLVREMTDAAPPQAREDRANLNATLLFGAQAAERRGLFGEALALTRRAAAESRSVGQNDRAFVQAWASLTARNAWRLAQEGETAPGAAPPGGEAK
jgi:hypothetical protein